MIEHTWNQTIYSDLRSGNFKQVAVFYESLLEQEPETIEYYWHLGLAYLLDGQEEAAQLSWLVALNQDSDEVIETNLKTLIKILEAEAAYQNNQDNKQLAWLIRGHIRELQPTNLHNLLSLTLLNLELEHPTPEKLNEWQVIELLESEQSVDQYETLFTQILKKIVYIPAPETLSFARFCLNNTQDVEATSKIIISAAKKINDQNGFLEHPVDLINVCRENHPDNLDLLKVLFWFFAGPKRFEEALAIANEFASKCQSQSAKIYASHQLLYVYLSKSDWDSALSIAGDHIESLITFLQQKEVYFEGFVASILPVLSHPLLYLQDNPQQNRYILNQLGYYYQKIVSLHDGANHNNFDKQKRLLKKQNNLPLKIGYIGSTFHSHSVGWLCRWLIYHHDTENFEIYLYGMTKKIDYVTQEWFINKAKKFYSYDIDADAVVKQIQEDEIDILVDLDSITLNLTCDVLVQKPAPVQVTWLGFDATGIPAVDYFIADPYVLPPNAQDYYSEKIWRLPQTYLAIDGFEMGVPTLRRSDLNIEPDAIIFMNLQGGLKRHPEMIRLQLQIIKSVPNSYLLIKGKADQKTTEHFFDQLAEEAGVSPDRLRFLKRTKTELEHRANLSIADVILDTYPYNGATTTLEVLWAGIPMVTRVGEQFASRNSYTFMINAGLSEGIAWTEEEYLDWGVKLGTDESLRQKIRYKLWKSRQNSPLWNGKQFTLEMENAYKEMWQAYLAQP